MTNRKSISKRIRFEVLERDNFTCQYCGRKAPNVILEVDHIVPVSKGGSSEYWNLATACADCNAGKYDITPNENEDFGILVDMRSWMFIVARANLKGFNELEFSKIINSNLNNLGDYEAFDEELSNCSKSYSEYIKQLNKYFKCVKETNEYFWRINNG
ncbi:MAG: HNH endonuclease [Smithella sp.]|jgi:CRISPR/Cas system Type II protein with McrA/HNH and RuvC-like nuclease domain